MPSNIRRARSRGFALLLVIITIALATAIGVFFLANVGRERRGVDLYSRGSDARHLADMSVNLVQGQINAATKEGTSVGAPISWASQPGMIRTYNQSGQLSNAYKLYSWDKLVEAGTAFDPFGTGELPDGGWISTPALYTDLNAPVNNVYPIADPRIANDGTGSPLKDSQMNSNVPTWDFPAEFSVLVDPSKGYKASTTNTLPMPVKWIYVLQDGTWAAPTSASGNTATVSGATLTNPIVGRIAFWTDDETSKVNINTASEGSFWDTPKAGTEDEMQFAGNPPARGEFQRISGHPATTSLSAIFPEMRVNGFSRWKSDGNSANSIYVQELRDLYSLTPRIDWGSSLASSAKQSPGGSQSGTFPVTAYTAQYAPQVFSTGDSIFLDSDRLYASADDMFFLPSRAPNAAFAVNATGTQVTNALQTPIAAAQMAQRLFLLTADSRAPETTLFETPRVSLWPITWPYTSTVYAVNGGRKAPLAGTMTPDPANIANNPYMTYQERLLAFDSTLYHDQKPFPYYFQRQAPDSPTYDWINITRNQSLVGYLSREMRQSPPGMGNTISLDDKWGTDNGDWIALNCFDYSRSLINQYTYSQTTSANDYLYTYTAIRTNSGRLNNPGNTPGTPAAYAEPNAYTVSPLHVPFNGNTYTTEGSFPALKEACLVFYATQRDAPIAPTADADKKDPFKWKNLILYDGGADPTRNKSRTTQMQAVMLLSFSGMNPGVWSYRGQTYFSPVFWVKVTRASGAGSFQVNDTDINFPASGNLGNVVQYSTNTSWSSRYMASMPASLFTYNNGTAKSFRTKTEAPPLWNTAGNWSLISDPTAAGVITADQTTFKFTGSRIQVDIYAPAANGDLGTDPTTDPNNLICSQMIDFGGWNSKDRNKLLPIPIAPRWNVHQNPTGPNAVVTPDVGYDYSASPGWQAEIVPTINLLTNLNILGGLDPRAPSYQIGGTSSTEPVPYAYTDNTGGTGCRSFTNRANAYRYSATNLIGEGGGTSLYYGSSQPQVFAQAYQLVTPYDTAISMVCDPSTGTPNGDVAGDSRLVGRGNKTSAGDGGSTTFIPIDTAFKAVLGSTPLPLHVVSNSPPYQHATDQAQYHSLSSLPGMRFPTGYWLDYQLADKPILITSLPNSAEVGTYGLYGYTGQMLLSRAAGDTAVGVETNVTNSINSSWDWTTLPGNFGDGGYINRPDQDYQITNGGLVPYFNDAGLAAANSMNAFVPNRQIPSPVVLGTLPASMRTGWQTLNFCPNPARAMNGSGKIHPGLGIPRAASATGAAYTTLPDHLLLDLFWMPVAEPYPISDRLSTAGKINLNYAMMPFPYIQRKNALDAVLKSVWMAALPSTATVANFARCYKAYGVMYLTGRLDKTQTRYPVDVDATLKAFDYKFSQGDIFRSASQICDMFLYPSNTTATSQLPGSSLVADTPGQTTNITGWWKKYTLTGDNVREDPYNAIYSRITTKSNTFTVHWKVQVLRKLPNSAPATWTENKDIVASELRGSTLIERYIDPNATNIPDYADPSQTNALPLSYYYKWRTVSENYFHP